MKCECSLKEFVKTYPEFRASFSNLLKDDNYICKFWKDSKGNLTKFEIGYKEDIWIFDNVR